MGRLILAAAHPAPVTSVSVYVAVIASVVALAVGWFTARWRRAERSVRGTRNDYNAAMKGAWGARRAMGGALIVLVVAADMWFRGKGR
jgi:hypothetical protein